MLHLVFLIGMYLFMQADIVRLYLNWFCNSPMSISKFLQQLEIYIKQLDFAVKNLFDDYNRTKYHVINSTIENN